MVQASQNRGMLMPSDVIIYYDEAFISATSMAAMPVTQINKVHLPGNRKRTLAICKMVRDWELTDN